MRKFFTTYNIICLTLLVLGIVFFCLIGLVPAFIYVSVPMLSAFMIMLGIKFYMKYKDYEKVFLEKEEQTKQFIIDNYGEGHLITFNADIQSNKKEFHREYKKYMYACVILIIIGVMFLFIL